MIILSLLRGNLNLFFNMKIIVDRNNLKENPAQFLRQSGYGFIQDRRTGNESFARRTGRDHYPRFHVYVKSKNDRVIFDMHLDQKRASYEGAHAHNAEYGGPVVEGEIARLKRLLDLSSEKNNNIKKSDIKNIPSAEDRLGNRNILDNIN